MTLIIRVFCLSVFFANGLAVATPKPNVSPSHNPMVAKPERAIAIFAGGCFWCMEPPFDKTKGVLETISGYIGGSVANPTYQQVSAGNTGHYEAIQIIYDPKVVGYEELLPIFWRNIDPVDATGQFCDKGEQYLSAIFTLDQHQAAAAQESLQSLLAAGTVGKQIATRILPASQFYPAEEYHQNYYQKNPLRYRYYRGSCGRDDRLQELWGKVK